MVGIPHHPKLEVTLTQDFLISCVRVSVLGQAFVVVSKQLNFKSVKLLGNKFIE